MGLLLVSGNQNIYASQMPLRISQTLLSHSMDLVLALCQTNAC